MSWILSNSVSLIVYPIVLSTVAGWKLSYLGSAVQEIKSLFIPSLLVTIGVVLIIVAGDIFEYVEFALGISMFAGIVLVLQSFSFAIERDEIDRGQEEN